VIAAKQRTTVAQIKKANGLRSDLIREGQLLKIPN
jgi:LysM repeat protein